MLVFVYRGWASMYVFCEWLLQCKADLFYIAWEFVISVLSSVFYIQVHRKMCHYCSSTTVTCVHIHVSFRKIEQLNNLPLATLRSIKIDNFWTALFITDEDAKYCQSTEMKPKSPHKRTSDYIVVVVVIVIIIAHHSTWLMQSLQGPDAYCVNIYGKIPARRQANHQNNHLMLEQQAQSLETSVMVRILTPCITHICVLNYSTTTTL